MKIKSLFTRSFSRSLPFFIGITLLSLVFLKQVFAANSATITSKNLLIGSTATVNIDSVKYTISALPGGTSATIQFSLDGTNWFNKDKAAGSETLLVGANNTLPITNYSGTSFYYKLTLNGNGTTTPIVDDIVFNYTTPDNYNWDPWMPTENETQIDSMDNADNTWKVDYNHATEPLVSKKITTPVNVGTGSDGVCTVTGTTTNINTQSCSERGTPDGVNFSSTVLTAAGSTSITLSTSPTGLAPGDEVLIINQQGTATNNKSVGLYENHIISFIVNNTLYFTDYPIKNTYEGITQKITVQRVPNYTDVTVGRTPSGHLGTSVNDAGYSCLDILNSGTNVDGETLSNSAGLVAHWKFNEANGTTAVDTTGNMNDHITATGGTVTTSGLYTVHTFSGNADFQVTSGTGYVETLVVAGGGAGSGGGYGVGSGGGGAGGVLYSPAIAVAPGVYPVTVGTGGVPSTSNGGNSIFSSLTAIGGGLGGSNGAANLGVGGNGGSGGGSAGANKAAGTGVAGQGFAGRLGFGTYGTTATAGGGGGGATALGTAATSATVAGVGGAGYSSSINGNAMVYGIGGNGGVRTGANPGAAAIVPGGGGGGGNGSIDGVSNTGTAGGAGGDGRVFIRYLTAGSSNNGTLTNFASTASRDQTETTGWTGQKKLWGAGALMFDGVDDYVNLPDNDVWAFGTNSFTIEAWINPSVPTYDLASIFQQGESSTNQYTNSLEISSNKLRWLIRDATATIIDLTSADTLSLGAWHHVVAVRNGTTFTIYINGVQQATGTSALSIPNSPYNVNIGRRFITAGTTRYFKGVIDSLRVYKRALPIDEINTNYINGIYWIDPDGSGGNAPIQAVCDMTRDGGGWTMALKTWYQAGAMGQTGALGAVANATAYKGAPYKLADTTVRDIIGLSQNFDVMGDANGWNAAYSSGNYEYVVLRNYTGYWRFDIPVSASITDTTFQSYRISDNALATTYNLACGEGGGAGINCVNVLANNPQGGAACNISMGSVSAGWHHFFMSQYNTDTYIYACNGAQHTSSYNLNHRFWVREKLPAVFTASPWDGTKGGILAFRANGTVNVSNGTITTAGIGYRGGSAWSTLWNGIRSYSGESYAPSTRCAASTVCGTTVNSTTSGGAGGILSSGGPGGSHGSLGSNGLASYSGHEPNKGLIGTTSGQAALTDRMLMGSAGGGGGDGYNGSAWGQSNAFNGVGGNGGGITFIAANTLTIADTGTIASHGTSGAAGWLNSAYTWISGGSGGGGAGGSIALQGNSFQLNNNRVVAEGGVSASPYYGSYGATNGNYVINPVGGNGGNGRVAILYTNAVSGSSMPAASINKVQTKNKIEGTGALQLKTGSAQTSGASVLWHFGTNSSIKVYPYKGADQTYTVPAGVTSVQVKMWGGGGGGGNLGGWSYGYPGGGGGYTEGTIAVTPGQVLTVMVGAGGTNGVTVNSTVGYGGGANPCNAGSDCRYGGQGGGRSAIRVSNTDILTAGGGGGGGTKSAAVSNMSGGGGGGTVGQPGWATDLPTAFGGGGTQVAGGAGATAANAGTAGVQYLGGRAIGVHSYGGSGGGGWYGGGGGGYVSASMGGGGGGSGYIGGAGVSAASTISSNGRIQANSTDYYNSGAGAGGLPSISGDLGNGNSGKVVIIPNVKVPALPYQEFDSSGYENHGTVVGTTLVAGPVGLARSFNGTTDYIDIPDSNTMDLSDKFSWEAWLNPTTLTGCGAVGGPTCTIVNKESSYEWGVDSAGNFEWAIMPAWAWTNTTATVPVGQWTHIALVYDGATVTTYKNGVRIASQGKTGVPNVNTLPVRIGARSAPSAPTQLYPGKIDEMRFSTYVRSSEEIAEAYRMGSDVYLNKTITLTDLSTKSSLPFSIAADKPGAYITATVGESAFANYQSDVNTIGLWHLDEIAGTGFFFKDSSSNNNHLQIWNAPQSTQGKIGRARYFPASTEIYNQTGIAQPATFTIDAWIKPSSSALDGAWHWLAGWYNNDSVNVNGLGINANKFAIWSATGAASSSTVTLTANQWYHVAITYTPTTRSIYINGQLDTVSALGFSSPTSYFTIGPVSASYPAYSDIDEVRLSNVVRTSEEIRQAYEAALRSHPVIIDFAADLDGANLIADNNDKSFIINATLHGLQQKADKILKGEKIVVSETYIDDIEYAAQGDISTVNPVTGAINVIAWDEGSTFPPGGFTTNASVFKWQKEYMDISGSLTSHRDAVTQLSLHILNGYEPRTIWLDDWGANGSYLTDPLGSTIPSATGKKYFQYKIIETTTDTNVSSTVSSVSLNYKAYNPYAPGIDVPVASSSTSIRWKYLDNSTNETGFRLFDENGIFTTFQTATNTQFIDEIGLSPNTLYTRKVAAFATEGIDYLSRFSATASLYTLANVPGIPNITRVLSSPTTNTTATIIINKNSNPDITQYAIYKEVGTTCDGTGGSYIKGDGSDNGDLPNGASAVWQTAAVWASTTITGLSPEQNYTFCVKAINGNGIETAFGVEESDSVGIFPLGGDVVLNNASSTCINRVPDIANPGRWICGVDGGTGNVNTAKLEIKRGSMTIMPNETLVAGSVLFTGGSLKVSSAGAMLKVGAPIWVSDKDADRYSTRAAALTSAQPPDASYKRRGTLTTFLTLDCNDDNAAVNTAWGTIYRDLDSDTYGNVNSAIQQCLPYAGYVGNSTDCDDATNTKYDMRICYLDADNDGYRSSTATTRCVGANCSNSPDLYKLDLSATVDCNDGAYSATNTCCKPAGVACTADSQCCAGTVCGTDADGDGHFNQTIGHSGTCQTAKPYDDCGDANASAFYGAGTCSASSFTHTAGGPSYDWNCNGAANACSAQYYVATTYYHPTRCCGPNDGNCCMDCPTSCTGIGGGSACGTVGYLPGSYSNCSNGCGGWTTLIGTMGTQPCQ